MEVGVAAAPVGDLGEGVGGQDVLGEQRESEAARPGPSGLTPQLPREGPQTLRREKEQRVESSCAMELLWEADAFPLQVLGGAGWWDNQGSPGGRQVYGAQNCKSESLKELKLWSQLRWSSRVGGGRQDDTHWGNTVCGLGREEAQGSA